MDRKVLSQRNCFCAVLGLALLCYISRSYQGTGPTSPDIFKEISLFVSSFYMLVGLQSRNNLTLFIVSHWKTKHKGIRFCIHLSLFITYLSSSVLLYVNSQKSTFQTFESPKNLGPENIAKPQIQMRHCDT